MRYDSHCGHSRLPAMGRYRTDAGFAGRSLLKIKDWQDVTFSGA